MSGAAAVEYPDLTAKVNFLSDGEHLGEPGIQVERVETHFAWVFLTPRNAYKLRKPVRYGGLDTRSIAIRRASCDEELRLNQELAPGVYLDVLRLAASPDGQMTLGEAQPPDGASAGQTIDWVLHMRRLPTKRMFDFIIREGSLQMGDLRSLAAHLEAFYSRGPGLPISGPSYCRRLRAATRRNCEELLAAQSRDVDVLAVAEAAGLQQQWIDAHRGQLEQRAEQRLIRDCHGDLKPEHVCFGPPVSVIDRLEFDPELRVLDPIEDLGFLWLECERLGAVDPGEWLVRHFVASSGARVALSLLYFYLSNRALTRAKLAVWRLARPADTPADWPSRLRYYVERALTAMRQAVSAGDVTLPP